MKSAGISGSLLSPEMWNDGWNSRSHPRVKGLAPSQGCSVETERMGPLDIMQLLSLGLPIAGLYLWEKKTNLFKPRVFRFLFLRAQYNS